MAKNKTVFGSCVTIEIPKTKKKTRTKSSKPKTPRPNPFAGANDIYLTPHKIAVTTTASTAKKRGHTKTIKTKYYTQNASNIRKLKAAQGATVRVGRTGTNYKNI